MAALEAAIAPGYRGTLDLCNCSSEHLAAHLKARRGDDVRVIFNTELLDPLPAYVIVRHLLALATRTEMDYRLLRLQAAHGLLKAG